MRHPLLYVLFAIAIGCKPSGTLEVDEEPETSDDVEESSPAIHDGALFDADHIIEVDIALDSSDWTELRNQSRDLFEVLGGDCQAQPFDSPFTYFEAEVTVDGELIETAGVRKKGFFGSLSYEKPSLKIKTDTYVDDQFMENGTERLTLNNNLQDPSLINQCLGYGVFAAAGLPAPRCNFAVVTVNGQDLGVYTHVEAVKKDFLKRHFTVPDGDLYEGTLSDFYDGAIGTFDAKTDDTDEDLEVIHEIRDALDAPDDEIIERLGAIIDLPAFYRFWAVETLVGHGDGYASNQNNFLIYRDPGTELVTFIPWGMDTLFQGVEYQPPAFITAWITQRLWSIPAGRDAYVEAMDEILETAWDEEALHDEIDRMEDLLTSHARDPATAAAYMDLARDYVDGRRASVTSQLPEMAGWDIDPEMRDPFCIVEEGTIDSEFNTLYDTLDAEDPFIYPATLYGESFPGDLYLGSVAGMDQDRFVVATYAVTEDWNTLYQVVAYVPAGVTPGTYDLAFGSAYAIAIDINVPDDEGDIIGLIFGTVTFDEVGENPGDPVVGSLNGDLIGGLF